LAHVWKDFVSDEINSIPENKVRAARSWLSSVSEPNCRGGSCLGGELLVPVETTYL
jgi:hypothetical protein